MIREETSLGSDQNFGSVRFGVQLVLAGSVRQEKIGGSVRFGFGKNSWFGRFLVCVRKRPKFWFGSVRDLAGFGRFGKKHGGSLGFGFGKNSWFGRFIFITYTIVSFLLHSYVPCSCTVSSNAETQVKFTELTQNSISSLSLLMTGFAAEEFDS